ncbi:leucine-rich repeat-containing protein 2 isoform X2 [Mauremys reevesii]|uniref:leucine-rich repeat-containing protein 2 isoform X2 n=1 Tax=Mauremys reevesii TaxID=260615 RepID=UPI00193F03D5|nr:leucine-rich repeat-containing protein 2 isoform X2 [Mauremys reevesii]XP_039401531.1 leucine-rich repeat-containing protein 2 isoform X2 [Mauremys reevesii]
MGHQVIIFDISVVRGFWETQVKKHKEVRKKEKERLAQSSLEKIKQEWDFVLECRKKGIPQSAYLKNGFIDTTVKILDKTEKKTQLCKKSTLSDETDKERSKFIFQLSGEHWTELPDSLKEQTHLKEWHIYKTQIETIPAYVALFQELKVLELSNNQITHLPVEIGCLKQLKELNVSFNNLKSIPPELGNCENLEKLDLAGNIELTELPFELSNLKQVTFVDVSANKFPTIPICILRMSSLHWLDISNNKLKDLPQDIDRLSELQTFLLQKNKLTYLPRALLNMPKLSLLVVSGDDLVEIPTDVCDSHTGLKFISLKDNPLETFLYHDTEDNVESERDREQFEKEFMKAYLADIRERESMPCYTTKVSFTIQL